jgi:hypothetical protein
VPKPISVLTADDQPLFLAAARAVIVATPGFELVGEASSGLEAISDLASVADRCGAAGFVRKQDLCPRVLAGVWDQVRSSSKS